MDLESEKICSLLPHSSQREPIHATLSQTWARSVHAQLNHSGKLDISSGNTSSSSSSSESDSDEFQKPIDWTAVRFRASQMRTSLARWNEARKLNEQKNPDTRANRDASPTTTTTNNNTSLKTPSTTANASNKSSCKTVITENRGHTVTHFVPIRPKPCSEDGSPDSKKSHVKSTVAHFDAIASASGSFTVGPGLTLHVGCSPPGKNSAQAQLSVSGAGKASLAAIMPYTNIRPTSPPPSPTNLLQRHDKLKRKRADLEKDNDIEEAVTNADTCATNSGSTVSIHNGRRHHRHGANFPVTSSFSESKRWPSCIESESGRVRIDLLREKILQQADSVIAAVMRKSQQKSSKKRHSPSYKDKTSRYDRGRRAHQSHNLKTEDQNESVFCDARAALVRLRQSGALLCDTSKLGNSDISGNSSPRIKKESSSDEPSVPERKKKVSLSNNRHSKFIKKEREVKKHSVDVSRTMGKTRSSSKKATSGVSKSKISSVSNSLGKVCVSKSVSSESVLSKSQLPTICYEQRLTRAQSARLSSLQATLKSSLSGNSDQTTKLSGSIKVSRPVKDMTLHPTEPSKQNARRSEPQFVSLSPQDSGDVRQSTSQGHKKKIAVRTYSSPSATGSPRVKQESLTKNEETKETGRALRSSTETDEGNSGASSPAYGREAECISNLLSLRAGAWS